jgi:tetratricopeptide (TPR) repeat protein
MDPSTSRPGRRFPGAAVPLILGAAVLATFLPSLWNGFVNWDDDANFTYNENFRGLSPSHLWWMFTTYHMANYQPLFWLSLAIDYEFWGMSPIGYHLTSLILHLAATLLFYRLLLVLIGRFIPPEAGRPSEPPRGPAAAGALLFGIHPLRVESVAWATERKDVLCGLFVMLTLLAYVRMDTEEREGRSGRRWLWLSLACFAASLLSKALGLMLPFVLLALDVYPLRRWQPGRRMKILREKIPFVALSAVEGILTYQAIQQVGLARSVAAFNVDRFLQAGYGLCFYLWKTVLPINLSTLYLVPRPFPSGSPMFWLCLLAATAASIACFVYRRRIPGVAWAWFCYVVLLLPVLGLANDALHMVADRYCYLAFLPWAVLAAVGLQRLAMRSARDGAAPSIPTPAAAVAAALLLAFGVMSNVQSRVWRDSIALWDQALKQNPANVPALTNRGKARAVGHDAPGALRDFEEAIRLDPEWVEAVYNRGFLRADAGDWDGAIRDQTEAIRLSADYTQAYRERARARKAKGDKAGADADLAEARRIESSQAQTIGVLGVKEPAAAAVDPQEVETLNNEGNRLATAGDFRGAIDRYTKAITLSPNTPGIYNNRGNARASINDHAGAVADYTDAVRLDSGFAEAYANRGVSKALLGDLQGAREDYSEALRLVPRDPVVLANRGRVRSELGDRAGGIGDLEAALQVAPPGWPQGPVVRALLARLRGF